MIALWTWMGITHANNRTPFRVASLYWHFVDAVWLAVFTTFYLLPYLR
jgi:heme/copper-type cytochrome/quinol oxidase subunit 3